MSLAIVIQGVLIRSAGGAKDGQIVTTLDNINGHLFGDEAERHLRLAVLALENIQDSVIIHDADGRMLYFNDVAATSLGYTPEEFAALPPWGFAADMAWEERENRMKEIRRQGTQCFLTEQMTLDGRRVVQEVTSRYVPTDGGAVFVGDGADPCGAGRPPAAP